MHIFTDIQIDGLALWVVLLTGCGVFLASFMDAICRRRRDHPPFPTYLLAFHGMPTYYALGTNKLSSGVGTFFSTARFVKNGYVCWRPGGSLRGLCPGWGSVLGTELQHHTPDVVLKYLCWCAAGGGGGDAAHPHLA